jgi:DNA-binding HxlR family transcriptional regulator
VTELPRAGHGREMTSEGQMTDGRPTDFPSRAILALIGDKWTIVVLYCLSLQEVRRFNELQRQIPDISKKMLVQTLRNLERDGLVERTVYPQVPPKTEYRLTHEGHRLREPIAELCRWAVENQTFLATILARRGLASVASA